jgi:hypothetical protein
VKKSVIRNKMILEKEADTRLDWRIANFNLRQLVKIEPEMLTTATENYTSQSLNS